MGSAEVVQMTGGEDTMPMELEETPFPINGGSSSTGNPPSPSSASAVKEDGASAADDDPIKTATDTAAKYAPKQRVYAKDNMSGLWYEAVIRRSLWGVNHNKQVQIGLVSEETEIDDILATSSEPMWHYFVHYNKWNVNWDRWVSEDDIMEETEESKQIANRYALEHKKLQKEFPRRHKKNEGAQFLKEWRKRMDKIEEEMKQEKEQQNKTSAGGQTATSNIDKKEATGDQAPTPQASKPKPKKKKKPLAPKDKWDKAAVDREYALQLRGLESKRSSQDQHKMPLPFSLKKIMVEAWEIITQCQMVSNLPAPVTVRQVLDKYLESKLELLNIATEAEAEAKQESQSEKGNASNANPKESDNSKIDKPENDTTTGKLEEQDEKLLQTKQKRQEWIDMTTGIAMFFDDALPFRLLYSQELPQYKAAELTFVVPLANEGDHANPEDHPMAEKEDAVEVDKDAMQMDSEKSKQEAASGDKKDGTSVDGSGQEQATEEGDTKPSEDGDDNDTKETEAESNSQDSNHADVSSETQSDRLATKTKEDPKSKATTRPMLPCELYGCEHLLRLFLKIPELLAEQQPKVKDEKDEFGLEALKKYENDCKQILAKIHDLIRFLHKHQSTMFADSYRKLNEAELKEEQKWLRFMERKRKRALEEKQANELSAKEVKDASNAETKTQREKEPSEGRQENEVGTPDVGKEGGTSKKEIENESLEEQVRGDDKVGLTKTIAEINDGAVAPMEEGKKETPSKDPGNEEKLGKAKQQKKKSSSGKRKVMGSPKGVSKKKKS